MERFQEPASDPFCVGISSPLGIIALDDRDFDFFQIDWIFGCSVLRSEDVNKGVFGGRHLRFHLLNVDFLFKITA